MFRRLNHSSPVKMTSNRESLMDEPAVARAIARMSRELIEKHGGTEDLVLMGIRRRGDDIAFLIRDEIERAEGVRVPVGVLDITLYRDDLAQVGPRPVIGESSLPPRGIDDQTVVLVDDVLFTGRTIRAALNELMDWGRPARTLLCTLIDRGGREVPICPDVVGKTVELRTGRHVNVLVPSLDDRLEVEIVKPEMGSE